MTHTTDIESNVAEFVKGKAILVTGGCGSIGGGIVERLLEAGPGVVRILSRDEGKHFDLQERLGKQPNLRFLVGDVRDRRRLQTAMKGIDVVFHAAAMKHVPACEYNPFEAVQTNVIGTQNVIQAAVDRGVKRVVGISTDKAMTPVNTMGASKLLAEKLIASANAWNPGTTLSCVRFGNVMASRGSVVPAMIDSILTQGEVRITEPAMTRFFMTIREAVNLTIEAARQAEGGEIFIFRMPALKLEDLVEVVIEECCQRAGLDPSSIRRTVIGSRAGEKLHEGLFSEEEVPRSERRGDMYVVHSMEEWDRKGRPDFGNVNMNELLSDQAPMLDRPAIRDLLERAGAWQRMRQHRF